jgi:tungstate transport system ATP-binding protein
MGGERAGDVMTTGVAPGTPLVTLTRATVRYGAVTALHDLNFSVSAGERIALLGSNGSGKSSLLRALHGQLDATQLDPLTRHASAGLAQAMVFQRPFMLHVSVWRNLMLPLSLAGVPRAQREQRAHEALERVGMSALASRAARSLSGGQQQRLALARAWMMRPELLFLDEPTASLDPAAKRHVEDLIMAFAADGLTMVVATHNLGQAKRLATRCVYMEAGQIICDEPTAHFFGGELPPQAAAFLRAERV